MKDTPRRKIFDLHPNIFFLGLVSLLTDTSSEMIFTIMPLFIVNVLGSSALIVGFVGGLIISGIYNIAAKWTGGIEIEVVEKPVISAE